MSLIIPEDLPDCIDKPVEQALTPIATNAGKTFGDLWFLAMGGISQMAEKKRIKYSIELEAFKKLLDEKVKAIPIENRIEPITQIACQALEDAKYCAENEEVREMFASLISSTMDNRTSNKVHPSFSAILKQMTSEDARFFQLFKGDIKLPVCNFVLNYKNNTHKTLLYYIFLKNKDTKQSEIDSNALSLSVLERLGLIHIHFELQLAQKNIYQVYEDSDLFQQCKKKYMDIETELVIQKGYAELTVLGSNLLEICCPIKRIYTTIASPSNL